jgi:hypothetical protein
MLAERFKSSARTSSSAAMTVARPCRGGRAGGGPAHSRFFGALYLNPYPSRGQAGDSRVQATVRAAGQARLAGTGRGVLESGGNLAGGDVAGVP